MLVLFVSQCLCGFLYACVCVFYQSNVIEAAPDMKRESEKEWYFGNADKERRGPFSFEEVSSLRLPITQAPKDLKIDFFKPFFSFFSCHNCL